jgi:hypothetical protein
MPVTDNTPPDMPQFVPEVPVCPLVEIVSCAWPFTQNKITPNAQKQIFLKFFIRWILIEAKVDSYKTCTASARSLKSHVWLKAHHYYLMGRNAILIFNS